jgi:hypothetical protein
VQCRFEGIWEKHKGAKAKNSPTFWYSLFIVCMFLAEYIKHPNPIERQK